MVKFIVVEDNHKFRQEIIGIIERVVFNTKYDYKLEEYTGYNDKLKKAINDCSLRKIYILDIALENSKSGIDIAEEIRESDWDSEIIIITSHDSMFETVHRARLKVYDFIEKCHGLNKRFEEDIRKLLAQKNDYGKFCFVNDKIKMQVYLKDITHIYRDTGERKLVIKTSNNNFLVNMSISEILKELDGRFKQVHRACIVNTDRVNLFFWQKGYFVLDNNEKVHLCSRNYKDKI